MDKRRIYSRRSKNGLFIQEVKAGFTWGQVRIKKLREDEVEYLPNRLDENLSDPADDDATIVIPFQNENLSAYMELNGTRTVNFFLSSRSVGKFFNFFGFSRCYR